MVEMCGDVCVVCSIQCTLKHTAAHSPPASCHYLFLCLMRAQVLSVFAQQVLALQLAVQSKAGCAVVEGQELSMRPTCSVFITTVRVPLYFMLCVLSRCSRWEGRGAAALK